MATVDEVLEKYKEGDYYPETEEEKRIVELLADVGILEYGIDLETKKVRLKVNREYRRFVENTSEKGFWRRVGAFFGSIGLKLSK